MAAASRENLSDAARGINRRARCFAALHSACWPCYHGTAPNPSTGAGENVMAKGQMRSNKEKKKPKADKNLKKGGAAPNPFASGKPAAGQGPKKG